MEAGFGPAFGECMDTRASNVRTTSPGRIAPRARSGAHSRTPLPTAYTPRARIDALLDDATQRQVTVLVAPAGTGKSVAVSGWAKARPQLDVRFLELDEDGVPEEYVESVPEGQGAMTILVVDDADQMTGTVSDWVATMRGAGATAPHVVLLARHDAGLVPTTARLEGQVSDLRFDELRFQQPEAHALVLATDAALTESQVTTILDRSRGWAAALVLMAQAAPPPDTPRAMWATPPALTSYLTDEVLAAIPAEIGRLLASLSEQVQVDMSEAAILSGAPDALRLLSDASADGFLLEGHTCLSTGAHTWRLHPLVLEVLRRRTARGGSERQTRLDAHRRASQHYQAVGDAAAALRHAILSDTPTLQVAALRRHAIELVARGHGADVVEALDALPRTLRENLVDVVALEAIVLRGVGRYEEAKAIADRALATADTLGARETRAKWTRDTEADVAILDVWQARCGWRHPRPALDRAARVLGCRESASQETSGHAHDITGIVPLRSAWLMLDLAALEIWRDELESASSHIDVAETHARETGLPRQLASAFSLRATLQMAQGSYQTAANTAQACLSLLAEHGLGGNTAAARAHLVRGFARFTALDLAGAASDLSAADAAAPDPFSPWSPAYRRILAANLLSAAGNGSAARQLLAEAEPAVGLPRHVLRQLSVARLRAGARMTDVAAVDAEANQLRALGYPFESEYAHGLALGLSGDLAGAVDLFDRVLAADEPTTSQPPIVGLSATASAAMATARIGFLLREGSADAVNRARHLLPDALTRMTAQHLLWLAAIGEMITARFTELLENETTRVGGHPMAPVALAALARERGRHLGVATGELSSAAREAAADAGLTPRELDVLRAAASGGSNASIAESLYLSRNTVKTHLAAVYRKLDVETRSDALEVARRRGML